MRHNSQIFLSLVIKPFLCTTTKSLPTSTHLGVDGWLTCFMLIGGVVTMSPMADMCPLETLLGVLISPRTFLTSYKFGYESCGEWSSTLGPWRSSKNVCKDLMIRKLNSWAVWSGRDLISWSLERGGLGLVWSGLVWSQVPRRAFGWLHRWSSVFAAPSCWSRPRWLKLIERLQVAKRSERLPKLPTQRKKEISILKKNEEMRKREYCGKQCLRAGGKASHQIGGKAT